MDAAQSPSWPVSRSNCAASPDSDSALSVTSSVPALAIVRDCTLVGPSSTSREPKSCDGGVLDSSVWSPAPNTPTCSSAASESIVNVTALIPVVVGSKRRRTSHASPGRSVVEVVQSPA